MLSSIPRPAMNFQFPIRLETLAALLIPLFLFLAAPRAAAGETYWTSVEGVTIWARVTGIHGSTVLMVMRGREYRVPLKRLTPESVAKARRLLDLPVATAVASCPKKSPRPKTSAEWIPVPLDELPTSANLADAATDTHAGVLPEKGELPPPPAPPELSVAPRTKIRLEGRLAIPPSGVPSMIQAAIDAGNRLQDKSYKWGGGRARLEDSGYDCSGSVSYVLIKAGLLHAPLTSGMFTRYGAPGPGRWITIYAQNGHVFMTLCGLRLDTGGHGGYGESGPRWCPNSRGIRGFVMRHPPGF